MFCELTFVLLVRWLVLRVGHQIGESGQQQTRHIEVIQITTDGEQIQTIQVQVKAVLLWVAVDPDEPAVRDGGDGLELIGLNKKTY